MDRAPRAEGKWLHLSFDLISTIDKSRDNGKFLLMFNGTKVGMVTNPEFALYTLNNLAWETLLNNITIHSKYFPNSDWLKAHAKLTTYSY